MTEKKDIPVYPYEINVVGLSALMDKYGISVDVAYNRAIEEAIKTEATEQIPYIEKAYEYLLSIGLAGKKD